MSDVVYKEGLDVSRIFLAYVATAGDVARTAQTAQCEIKDVVFLSTTELWDKKLSDGFGITVGAPAGEDAAKRAREINRAACLVQAQRLRALVDAALQTFFENSQGDVDPKALEDFCEERDKKGNAVFSTKPVLELVKAAEACHVMLYRALGDTLPKDQADILPGMNVKNLHLSVVNHLANTGDAVTEAVPVQELKPTEQKFLPVDEVLS